MLARLLLLATLFASQHFGLHFTTDSGTSLDPSGRAIACAGSAMDPNGNTLNRAGSSMDPNGNATTDDGRGIDPNG